MRVHLVLITEGPSDDGLLPHLEALCVEAGAEEVTSVAPDFGLLPEPVGRSVESKLRVAMRLEPNANLFLIHRDADARNPSSRYQEIAAAVNACSLRRPWAAIVPVQEMEAWLLLDESAIRQAVSRPNGRTQLRLPSASNVESVARPKQRLQQALIDASSATGRNLERVRRDFGSQRRRLLLELNRQGSITSVPSWRRMCEDVRAALTILSQEEQSFSG